MVHHNPTRSADLSEKASSVTGRKDEAHDVVCLFGCSVLFDELSRDGTRVGFDVASVAGGERNGSRNKSSPSVVKLFESVLKHGFLLVLC